MVIFKRQNTNKEHLSEIILSYYNDGKKKECH